MTFIHRGRHLAAINRDPLDIRLRAGQDVGICGSLGEVFTKAKTYL